MVRRTLVRIVLALAVLCAPTTADEGTLSRADAYLVAQARYTELAPDAGVKPTAAAIKELARTAVACGESTSNPARKEARSLLRKRLGKRKQPEQVLIAVIDAYGTIAVPKSSRDIKRFVDRKTSRKMPRAVRKAAVDACARIHDPGTHEYLVKLLVLPTDNADDREVAKASAVALRLYKSVPKKYRYKMLDAFMKGFNSIQGAASGTFMPSATSSEWWDAVKDPMIESFNVLTGQECGSFHDCARWWKENRRAVKAGKA